MARLREVESDHQELKTKNELDNNKYDEMLAELEDTDNKLKDAQLEG